ncbi:MAG: tRNA dihydrouridine synthase DusB [Anaerosomatales bacterium]|nr:tRNA dihydrouridine synthase DusB [Anaerosomatales bacterium]MDT8434170.1 tRNA dihydrouridine synthase DusB [Anaerosomatales bacterium]
MTISRSADIRSLLAPGSVVLGPMAGITEAPFRGICKQMGARLTYTEMVSAKGLHYNPDSAVSRALLTFDAGEVPCAVQLFGSEPEIMADQASRIVEERAGDVALVDINMGCPMTKVVAKGEGAALMRTPELAAEIVSQVVEACSVPVTVKFRAGWDGSELNAPEFARRMEAAGAAAVAVHGRTRAQFYRGRADWSVLAEVKRAVSVPVIGSGDVFSAADASAMLEKTGVDVVMVARGAQGNPWIFREAAALIERGEVLPPPDAIERIEMALRHAGALQEFGGNHTFPRMRKHVGWYIVGMPGATRVRERVNHIRSYEELHDLLTEYRCYLERRAEM